MVIGIPRSPERENLYLWVCKVINADTCFIRIDGKAYDLESAKRLNSSMLHSGTRFDKMLADLGYKNVIIVPNSESLALMLINKRSDVWLTPVITAKWIWKTEKNKQKLTVGPDVSTSEQWIVMSKDSEPSIADALKKVFTKVNDDGAFKKILRKYGND